MILLDWTRMGHAYCLAGAVWQGGQWRIVRPLMARNRDGPARNMGWSPFLIDGRQRWGLLELVGPEPARPAPPHLEDVWVHSLRPRKCLADPDVRRAILQATCPPSNQPLFGAPLQARGSGGWLHPGQGCRSLVCTLVPTDEFRFRLLWKPDGQVRYRAHLGTAELDPFGIPITDHTLLSRAEQEHERPEDRLAWMTDQVRRMGETVAVRLGVSRPFAGESSGSDAVCWLMVDGFFSPTDPQP
jgi:hypothetical protein